MSLEVKFIDAESDEALEKWHNAQKWVHVGEEILIGHRWRYKVVRVVHSGQFYVNCYCTEIK